MRWTAEDNLCDESSAQRNRFKPAVIVRDPMREDPSRSRKALRVAVKRMCIEEDEAARQEHLLHLPRQELSRTATPVSAKVWADAVVALPPELFKFELNASHDTLPHNANFHLWKKKNTDLCPICGERQTLIMFSTLATLHSI